MSQRLVKLEEQNAILKAKKQKLNQLLQNRKGNVVVLCMYIRGAISVNIFYFKNIFQDKLFRRPKCGYLFTKNVRICNITCLLNICYQCISRELIFKLIFLMQTVSLYTAKYGNYTSWYQLQQNLSKGT